MQLRIEQADGHTLAEVDDYAGPVPRAGERVWCDGTRGGLEVKEVTWGITGPRYEAEVSTVTVTVRPA